jgi:hypothetical protein
MVKIIIGAIMIIGGLSGNLVLIGTDSGVALAGLGAILVIWGIVRIVAAKRSASSSVDANKVK